MAERHFYVELRRLVSAAGWSCRKLEESTSSTRTDSNEPSFFSKSQWARWLNGTSSPPRKAVRKLAESLGKEELEAGHLVELWDKAFISAGSAPADNAGLIRPRQLPTSAQRFIGRTTHLKTCTELLDQATSGSAASGRARSGSARPGSGPMVIVIEGTAGVGKTTLATHFAHSVSDLFPDGQLFVNMRAYDHAAGPMSVGDVLPGFLDALGVAPQSFPESADGQAALYRSVLAGKRVLIVIDNVRDAEQVRGLLPGGPGSLVLVTSRNQLAGLAAEGARPVRLDPFTAEEAHELLDTRLGAPLVEREPQAASELIELCAGLPLALSVAAAYAATHPDFPLTALTSEFRRWGLDMLETGDPATTTRSVFAQSYHHLGERAALVFRLLGVHPGPDIPLAAIASLTALPAEQARRAVDELTRAHLLDECLPGRFTFHALLRAYAAELANRLDTAAEREAAAHRLLDHYLHTAMAAAAELRPYLPPPDLDPPRPGVAITGIADPAAGATWFAAESPVLLALICHADAAGFDGHAWKLPWALSAYFQLRGRLPDYLATQRTAVAAANRLGEPLAQAHSHYHLAFAQERLCDRETAWQNAQRALELFRELGDRGNEAAVLCEMAVLLERQGRHAEALEFARDGLALAEAAGHRWTRGMLENNFGWMCAHLGEHEQALSHCQRALSLHHELGNALGMAATLDSIGYIYQQNGDYAESRASYKLALAVYREIGDLFGEGLALNGLGDTYAAEGDVVMAKETWLRAAATLEQLSHPLAREVRAKLMGLSRAGAGRSETWYSRSTISTPSAVPPGSPTAWSRPTSSCCCSPRRRRPRSRGHPRRRSCAASRRSMTAMPPSRTS